jgi:VWFA-related protein
MPLKLALLRALLITAIFTGMPALAQDQAPMDGVYRVSVRLVVVDAQVLDKKHGQPLRSLKQEDFQILEDGAPQQIKAFSQDRLALSVVLLFDLTDSVRPVLQSLADGALEALRHLKPEDEVAVMTYAASTELIQDFTQDRELAAAAIKKASRMQSPEAAFFNEGIYQASAQLSKSQNRKVIIWLTDDVPNIPDSETQMRYGRSMKNAPLHSKTEAMKQLFETGTVVCSLLRQSDISISHLGNRSSERILAQMMHPPGEVYEYARATGGQVVESTGKKMKEKLAELIDDLRMRYSLGYRPSATKAKGKFCAIKVKLTPEALQNTGKVIVQAKEGYYR